MQLIRFAIIMIGLTSYLEYAKAQNKELLSIEGIVIYDNIDYKIPLFMIFIPATANKGEKLDNTLKRVLSQPDTRGYVIYFQSLRWILPNLEDIVSSLNYITIEYGGLHKAFKVGYGKFTMDKTFKSDPEIPENKTITKAPLYLDEKEFFLNVSELPEDMGTPKLFEAIN